MKKKEIFKAIVALAVALAFVMPVAAFANFGTIGVISNSENTGDMEIMVESTNSDNSDNIETAGDDEKPVIDTEESTIVNNPSNIVSATRGIIYVDDDRPPEWYNETQVKTITEGVTNATAGDTVYVYNGTYNEKVNVNKQLDLIGESRENVIVNGPGSGNVFYITTPVTNVNISTFTITNGKYGIYIYKSSYNNVMNCNIYGNSYYGIYIYSSSNYNNITNCDVYNNKYSFYIYSSSSYNSITNCNVHGNSQYGIYIYSSSNNNNIIDCDVYDNAAQAGVRIYSSSNNNNIIDCDVYDNTGQAGIWIYQSSYNNIINCNVSNTPKWGIYLNTATNCNITNCNVYNNGYSMYELNAGIALYSHADNNVITNCHVYNNAVYGIFIRTSSNNRLDGNIIYDNAYNFGIEGTDISHFYHNIAPSNTVNGRPIWYLIETNNFEVNETHNFGFLGLISCNNVTAKNADVCGILVVNTTNSTISNVNSHNSLDGIYIWMSSYINIINCNVYNNSYYGILFKASCNYNNITNCNSYNNANMGIKLDSSSNNIITNCDVYNNNRGVWLDGSSNNNIINCNVYNNFGSHSSIYLTSSTDNNIINCSVYNNSIRGIQLCYGASRNNVINCSVYNNTGYGIFIRKCSNNKLQGNTIYDNAYNFGFELLTTDITHFYHDIDTTNTVNGKPIYYLVEQEDMTLDGAIYDFGFLGLISCNNITAKNADVCGILMVNTTNSTISNVNSHDGGTHGIYIWMASDNSIINCNSYNNAGRGIFLDSSSYNNIITNCDVYNNSGHGIYLKTSSNNIITNCDIYNTQGAYLDSSSNCTFANCRVIDNSGTYGFYAISSDFTSIIGGNYSHNGIDAEGASGYNIYFKNSQYITIDGVIVDEPVQGPKAEPSCPFIYSWDGTDYVFDSESLVWTGCWWWEGDTNARLPSLRLADDDTYKIKVTEELPEITYYDKIQLVAVDHPDNTEVYSDTYGNYYTISNPSGPISCVNEYDESCLDIISEKDGIRWNMEPDPRKNIADLDGDGFSDSTNESDYFTYLDLEFENQGDYAKLIWSPLNAPGDSERWKELLWMTGNNNLDLLAQWAWDGTMFCHMRQMKDTVWLWDGTDWVEQHIGFEMFAAQKAPDMIVPLDLTDITTPTVKIRITSATGLGGPDYVWMDFSDDKIQSITPVNMSSADFIVNGTGVPGAMEKLADDDSNYIVMDTGDYGFLEFERLSPPLQARTFFVESNGYYYYDKWHNIVNMTNETKDFIYSILTDKILAMRYFSPRVFSGCAYGIYLDHSDNAIINNVSGRASNIQTGDECEEYGVYLSTCNYATLTNISLTNWEFGIYLTSSDNNNIMNCNAYNNNEYGIYLYSSSNGNVIYHNNFIDNVQNAYDACSNTWDDGYPSGGNYWSDYSGVDNYSGPGQNISGSDGIGDTPYNITGGSNQDRYPSMAMWDTIPPTITDVQATPAIQNTTEPVNITCTVVDNRDLVDTVKLNITGPEGFTLEVTMNVNGSSYYYENTYTTMGFYYYYIWANDTQGNIAVSDTYLFTITEFDKPISSVDPLPTWRNTVPFTVTATAYDNTGVANVTLYYQYSSNGTEWTEWTAYGTDTVEPWSWEFIGSDGYHKFYSVAVDTQGNVEDPPDVADASTGIDTVPPVTTVELDGTMGDNGWFVSDVEVTLSATDNLSGVSSTWFRIDSGYWTIYTGVPFTVSGEGEYTVQYYSFDIAGNIEDTKSVDIKIDTIPPVTEHEFDGVIGEDGWFVSDVTVTLSAEDQMPFVLRSRSTTLSTGSSGVNYTMYKVDDGEWTTYVDPFVVTEDGEHILYYYSVDLAGNQEETKEADFKIDHDVLPPVTTHGFAGTMGDNGWFVSDVTVTLGAVDISPSGVNHTYYKLDEGEWQEYTSAFSVTEDGVHTLYYYSVDYVGNNETVKGPFDFKIDQTPPTIELNATKIGFMKWLLNATVFDETSGIAKVEFYVDGEFVGEVTEEPYEWVYSGTGNKARAIVYDNAGNEALSKEVTPYSQGQSQSISSSSASSPLGIFSWLFGLW